MEISTPDFPTGKADNQNEARKQTEEARKQTIRPEKSSIQRQQVIDTSSPWAVAGISTESGPQTQRWKKVSSIEQKIDK